MILHNKLVCDSVRNEKQVSMEPFDNLSERDRAVLQSIFDPTATIGEVQEEGDKFDPDEEPTTEAEKESSSLCAEGVRLAEAGELDAALQAMTKAVTVAPQRAAGFNDRAQLLRLMKRDDEAMLDIDKAIELTTGKRCRARALSLCQRGVLLRKSGKDDEARAAFAEAAKLGSSFARKQVVELNPYAALCNQMLGQVLRGESDIKI